MKTARQVLFERHRDVEAELNRLREQTVVQHLQPEKEVCSAPTKPGVRSWLSSFFDVLWLDLIVPAKRIWIGFAAIWAIVLAVNLADTTPAAVMEARAKPVSDQVLVAWLDQQKVIAQLFPGERSALADRPRPTAPKPRSQCEVATRTC